MKSILSESKKRKKASSGTRYQTLTPFQLSQLESIVSGDRDYGLHSPHTVLKGPVHFAPEISGDVRAFPSTDVSSESMMQSARRSGVERGTGDRILKPRISNGEGDDNEKCIRVAKGGRGGKSE